MRVQRYVFMLAALVIIAAQPLLSQVTDNKSEAGAKSSWQQPKHHYKLNFVLKETDGGNVINQRSFTLGIGASAVRDSDRASLRAGTRIPLPGEKGIDYVDMGMDIDVYNAVEGPEGLQMHVDTEISSPATEPAPSTGATAIRQIRARSAVLARVSKSTLVFSADDPASKHRFELDVTPTQLD